MCLPLQLPDLGAANVKNTFAADANWPTGFKYEFPNGANWVTIWGHCPRVGAVAGGSKFLSSRVWTVRVTIRESTGLQMFLSRNGAWQIDWMGQLATGMPTDQFMEDTHIPLLRPAKKPSGFGPGCQLLP